MLYKTIFLKSKKEIDKRLSAFDNLNQMRKFLETTLKNEILKTQKEIEEAKNKIKCNNCGACCNLAISEFDPETLKNKAQNNDKTAKSFLETFEPYKDNKIPFHILPADMDVKTNNNSYFYHCKKVKFNNTISFCPIYSTRPSVCRNFPDTPLENLPKTCAYNVWKDENEVKALFIKALNDIRKFYLDEINLNKITKGSAKN